MSLNRIDHYASWEIDLGGICYREMWLLGQLLEQLGDKGNIDGKEFDLEELKAIFDATSGDVFLTDGINTTLEEEP